MAYCRRPKFCRARVGEVSFIIRKACGMAKKKVARSPAISSKPVTVYRLLVEYTSKHPEATWSTAKDDVIAVLKQNKVAFDANHLEGGFTNAKRVVDKRLARGGTFEIDNRKKKSTKGKLNFKGFAKALMKATEESDTLTRADDLRTIARLISRCPSTVDAVDWIEKWAKIIDVAAGDEKKAAKLIELL